MPDLHRLLLVRSPVPSGRRNGPLTLRAGDALARRPRHSRPMAETEAPVVRRPTLRDTTPQNSPEKEARYYQAHTARYYLQARPRAKSDKGPPHRQTGPHEAPRRVQRRTQRRGVTKSPQKGKQRQAARRTPAGGGPPTEPAGPLPCHALTHVSGKSRKKGRRIPPPSCRSQRREPAIQAPARPLALQGQW